MRRADGVDLRRRAADLSRRSRNWSTGLLEQGRIVYICTNGVFMRKKMQGLPGQPFTRPRLEPTLDQLAGRKADHREGRRDHPQRQARTTGRSSRPRKWMYWNVHVDGLEYTHDLIVEREGVFKECVEAIRMAKILGFQVATNTTVYQETDVQGNRADVRVLLRRWGWMATRSRPATITTPPRRTWSSGWARSRRISSSRAR